MLSDRRRVLELTTGAGRTTTMTYLPDGDGMIVVAGAATRPHGSTNFATSR